MSLAHLPIRLINLVILFSCLKSGLAFSQGTNTLKVDSGKEAEDILMPSQDSDLVFSVPAQNIFLAEDTQKAFNPTFNAQNPSDSIWQKDSLQALGVGQQICVHPLKWQIYIPPIIAFGYGFAGIYWGPVKHIDNSIRSRVLQDVPDFHTKVDNYLQFSPAVASLALGASGVKGRHSFGKQAYTYALSFGIMVGTVYAFKIMGLQLRPDGSAHSSFPSGHTASAFSGAEALRIEYGWRSPWIGIAGYTAATATGVLRVLNNRHWFSDVVAGAGLGFLSTRLSYFLIPKIEQGIFHKTPKENIITHF